jgi:hypothetical protein
VSVISVYYGKLKQMRGVEQQQHQQQQQIINKMTTTI